MTQTFTPDDLLRYLYEDTTTEEKLEIEKALQSDTNLQQQFEQLQEDMQLLDDLALEPSTGCVNHIMEYASAMNLKALCN